MRNTQFSNAEQEAYHRGWRMGCRAMFHEIENIRNGCEYPEDLEMDIDRWLDDFRKERRFLK